MEVVKGIILIVVFLALGLMSAAPFILGKDKDE